MQLPPKSIKKQNIPSFGQKFKPKKFNVKNSQINNIVSLEEAKFALNELKKEYTEKSFPKKWFCTHTSMYNKTFFLYKFIYGEKESYKIISCIQNLES